MVSDEDNAAAVCKACGTAVTGVCVCVWAGGDQEFNATHLRVVKIATLTDCSGAVFIVQK